MNVDEAIAYASKDKCFWAGEVHTALETLAKEVERLRAEVEMGNSFHRVAVKERDFERLLVEALKEELAAAKAASVVPVDKYEIGINYKNEVTIYMHSRNDAESAFKWLQGCMKDTPPTT